MWLIATSKTCDSPICGDKKCGIYPLGIKHGLLEHSHVLCGLPSGSHVWWPFGASYPKHPDRHCWTGAAFNQARRLTRPLWNSATTLKISGEEVPKIREIYGNLQEMMNLLLCHSCQTRIFLKIPTGFKENTDSTSLTVGFRNTQTTSQPFECEGLQVKFDEPHNFVGETPIQSQCLMVNTDSSSQKEVVYDQHSRLRPSDHAPLGPAAVTVHSRRLFQQMMQNLVFRNLSLWSNHRLERLSHWRTGSVFRPPIT